MLNIRRGDIFYVKKMGVSVGSEQWSGRPGVVISCEANNIHCETVEVAYCTTQPKANLPTHVKILSTNLPSTVLCEQINTVSVERLGTYIGRCTADEMRDIDIAVATALGLKKYPGLMEHLKERENQKDAKESKGDQKKEEKPSDPVSMELASVMVERDTYRRLYEDLVGRLVPQIR